MSWSKINRKFYNSTSFAKTFFYSEHIMWFCFFIHRWKRQHNLLHSPRTARHHDSWGVGEALWVGQAVEQAARPVGRSQTECRGGALVQFLWSAICTSQLYSFFSTMLKATLFSLWYRRVICVYRLLIA